MRTAGLPLAILLATSTFLVFSSPSSGQSSPSQYLVPLLLTSEAPLRNGTIVEVRLEDLLAALPPEFDPDWNATTVLHQRTPIPSQVERYNSGDIQDVLVFKITEPPIEGEPRTYQVWIPSKRLGLEVSLATNVTMLSYEEFAETPFGFPGNSYSDQIGHGYVIQNTMIQISVPLGPADIAGSVFNLRMEESGWDAIKQNRNPVSPELASAWRNSFFGHAWEESATDGYTLVASAIGPLRGTLVLKTSPLDGGAEQWRIYHVSDDDTLVEIESFIRRVDIAGRSNLTLSDHRGTSGEFDTLFVPGLGDLPRDERAISRESLTEAWVLAYSQARNRGVGILLDDRLETLEWTQDAIVARHEEADHIRTGIVSFDSTVTSDPLAFVANVYSAWRPRPVVEVLPAERSEIAPSLALDNAAERIASFSAEIEALQIRTESLEADLTELNRQVSVLLSTLNDRQYLEYLISAALAVATVVAAYLFLKGRRTSPRS